MKPLLAMGVVKNPFVLCGLSVLELLTYYSAHRLIGLSPGMVDGIAKRGIPRDRIHMISNGCDLSLFQGAKSSPRPQGVNKNDLMAIYAGTHGLANGLEALLDVALELKRRGRTDIKLVLVGSGKLKPALQARAQYEQLDMLIFLEAMPKAQLTELMAGADLGLQILANVPAFYDGTSPNKFFDYLAAGLPILTNYPGWLAEKIKASDCGLVVPPENPVAFVDALACAAANRERLREQGKRAHQLAEHEYNRRVLADRWVDVLEEAAECVNQKRCVIERS